jgi:serine/threonine protein phosphatase PrpC
MSRYETTSVAVAYRKRCEDRVLAIDLDDAVVLAVADGAGGTGSGDQAADAVLREVTAYASRDHDDEAWREIPRQTDFRIGAGESTGAVVVRSASGFVGASVGDCKVWLLEDGTLHDLTENQARKPLLGSGEAQPVGFARPASDGLLLVATDGFCNYVKRETLLREILWIDFAVLARKLVEMVRLPSGDLWDDVGIVACRPRRRAAMRR